MLCTDFEWGFPESMETPLPTPLYHNEKVVECVNYIV